MNLLRYLNGFLLAFIFSVGAWAYDLKPCLDEMPQEIQVAAQKFKSDHNYKGYQGLNNYYAKFTNPVGRITRPLVIITGLEDPIPDWYEAAWGFTKRGFRTTYVVELRGQGQSERVFKNTKLIHINEFGDYRKDLLAFLKHIKSIDSDFDQQPYVLAHSAGATVLTNSLYEIRSKIPEAYPVAISFWAPLVKMRISPYLDNWLVTPILRFANWAALKFNYPILAQKFKVKTFEGNSLTTDPEKLELSDKFKFECGLGSTAVTLNWGIEALRATKRMREQTLAGDIKVPTLLFKADDERVVRNDYKIENPKIKVVTVEGSRHALSREKNQILQPLINKTAEFFLNTP